MRAIGHPTYAHGVPNAEMSNARVPSRLQIEPSFSTAGAHSNRTARQARSQLEARSGRPITCAGVSDGLFAKNREDLSEKNGKRYEERSKGRKF